MRWAPLTLGAVAVLLAGCGIEPVIANGPDNYAVTAHVPGILGGDPAAQSWDLEDAAAFCGPQRAVEPVYMGPEGGHYIIQALGPTQGWTVAFHCLTASTK